MPQEQNINLAAQAFAEALDAINLETQRQGAAPVEAVARIFAEHEARCCVLDRAQPNTARRVEARRK